MADAVYLAVDVGASSGRVVAGLFDGNKLALEEVYRFENGPVTLGSRVYWDLLAQWSHVCRGLQAAASRYGGRIKSVGVDTWGVDFGLLGRGDELLGNPRHYRDHHTDGIVERALEIVSREEIFAETGLQFMQFNTLFQLLAMRLAGSPLLDGAESLLMVPDLFHWLLTGQKTNELTNATTSQCYNPRERAWCLGLLDRFGLPGEIFGTLIEPGTRLGPLLPHVAAETGLAGVEVVVPGTHDTASAVVAVPSASRRGERPDWCYISSGTWSLMGVESPTPVINDLCRELNFTNEGGVEGSTRLLKNITGLWLVQECRRIWNSQGRELGWEDLDRLCDAAQPLASLIDPDDARFMAPTDMPEEIRTYCRQTSQPVPGDEGAVVRTALDSLALKCRRVLGWLEQLIGGRLETIHIVGGGTKNHRLCQATANACGRPVVAGPIEATAIGNIVVQAVADGTIGSVAEGREVIRKSFPVEHYEPRDTAAWDEAYSRFESNYQ